MRFRYPSDCERHGIRFIVGQLVVGAIIDTVGYLTTTENASLGGLAIAVAGGVESGDLRASFDLAR